MIYIILGYIVSIVLSFLILRYAFINMEKYAKESAPIPIIIFMMLIPIINIFFGLAIVNAFVEKDCSDIINKIFRIKS
jgi:RsiW-degrading membrane proteinase PrsW (M82 family)